jgi:hypothetical protein
MALPGGFFYVNSGLVLAADEEAELAGVMAHETAHVCAHHAAREMTRANYAQLGTIPLIFIGGWAGYGIYEAASLAIPLTFLQFSREFEAQADYLGVQSRTWRSTNPELSRAPSPITRRRPIASPTRRKRSPRSFPRVTSTWSRLRSLTKSRRGWRASRTSAS